MNNISVKALGLSAMSLFMGACNSSSVAKMIQASGRPGEVMLVMDGPLFETQQTYSLIDILSKPASGLPQEESQLKITSRVPKTSFDGMMQRARNILMVDVDSTRFSKSTVKYTYNEWADGQLVVTLSTPSLDSLASYMKQNQESVSNLFVRHELYRFGCNVEETYSKLVEEKVDSMFHYRINVPHDIRSSKVGKNFLWFSNAQMGGRHDLLVYTFPYKNKKDLFVDRLIEVRDSVLKANIPGEFDGTYPSTVKTGWVYRTVTLPDEVYRGELRGLWQMEGGAMMGGPFVLQALHNEKDGLVYVFDTFVYKPNEDKLNLVRAMEATLYSVRPSDIKKFDPKLILSTTYSKSF